LTEEIIADVRFLAGPEQSDLERGRVVVNIAGVKTIDESEIPDGDYDFLPVTAGLFTPAVALPLRKSGDHWNWRTKK
jgi:hypothetical protein